MADNETRGPEEVLTQILLGLQGDSAENRLQAIAELQTLTYSSTAVRAQLEQLALHDENSEVRRTALAALDLPISRHIRGLTTKLSRAQREAFVEEIDHWLISGLLDAAQADVIKRRYDFDFVPPPPLPSPVSSPQGAPTEVTQPLPGEPAVAPRTLLQTLLSETSIKIALYLGAFFVIASAIILGTLVEAARLPILIIGLAMFGGLALAIRRRLPQPSFALFIVFSFLLPITANVIEDSLNLIGPVNAAYWVFVSAFMALIWSGSTWLYESRLFSLTAFLALSSALARVGDIFEAEPAFHGLMLGFAALAGLFGVWALKQWKDYRFVLPLLLAAQILQAGVLGYSLLLFTIRLFETSASPLWQLASVFTWGFAFCFYVFSDVLYSFPLFRWFAAATLVPISWFFAVSFELDSPAITILFFGWGLLLSAASELIHRVEAYRKYNLPILLASIPAFGVAITDGLAYHTALGLAIALGVFVVYGVLHFIRARGWLWALALFNFVIAYFAFFSLPTIERAEIFIGYQLLGLSLIFLLPDLFLNNDFEANLAWRLPLRLYGAFLTVLTFLIVAPPTDEPIINIVAVFAIYAVFFGIYALRYRQPLIAYTSTLALVIIVIHVVNNSNNNPWLPALTALALLYFVGGLSIRARENWSLMLRNSALFLTAGITFVALITFKETGGWYVLAGGLLFTVEMYLRRNGWFEIGLPVLFSMGTLLILRDLNVDKFTYHLLAYSIIWILADLLAHLTFVEPRPLKWPVRGVGALFSLANYGLLLLNGRSEPQQAVVCFVIYTLLSLAVSLLYRQPALLYTFTGTLPLFVAFLFREFGVTQWIHPLIVVAVTYYGLGYFFRRTKRLTTWETTLLFSGLGLGLIVSAAAPILGGLDAAIPVAVAATLWAVEAFERRNVWLGFPTNALYLLAYFIILVELKVDEPQFFSMGAALLGLIQHYLLTRAGSRTGAFITGMVSQFVLLGTTYIQMLNTEELIYFVVLFFQSIAVMTYGLVIRSRSLTFFPIGFVVLGVVTVIYSALKGISTVVLIGCTGMILLTLGILAVVMRERITRIGERLSGWQA